MLCKVVVRRSQERGKLKNYCREPSQSMSRTQILSLAAWFEAMLCGYEGESLERCGKCS